MPVGRVPGEFRSPPKADEDCPSRVRFPAGIPKRGPKDFKSGLRHEKLDFGTNTIYK